MCELDIDKGEYEFVSSEDCNKSKVVLYAENLTEFSVAVCVSGCDESGKKCAFMTHHHLVRVFQVLPITELRLLHRVLAVAQGFPAAAAVLAVDRLNIFLNKNPLS